jgi:hypothetical protein
MHDVREFAGHADIRTTKVYFVRMEEDAEIAGRRIQIRVTRSGSELVGQLCSRPEIGDASYAAFP